MNIQSFTEQMFLKGLIVFFVRVCYTKIKYAQRIKNMIIWFLTGLWVLLGCAEVAHLITIMTDASLQTYAILSSIVCLAGLFVFVGIFFVWYKKQKKSREIVKKTIYSPVVWVFVILTGATIYRFCQGYVPSLEDGIYEIVLSNLESDSLLTEHPFRGGPMESAIPMRFQILGLSSLYTALITFSQQSQYMIMCKAVPLLVWISSILVYWMFAEDVFGENIYKKWLFVSCVAGIYLATIGSQGLPGERLFYAGFSGETIRGLVLMPYALYVCWHRKWLLAIVAILAEACLVWTTYGFGYCALIALCMFGVHLFLDWRVKHAA